MGKPYGVLYQNNIWFPPPVTSSPRDTCSKNAHCSKRTSTLQLKMFAAPLFKVLKPLWKNFHPLLDFGGRDSLHVTSRWPYSSNRHGLQDVLKSTQLRSLWDYCLVVTILSMNDQLEVNPSLLDDNMYQNFPPPVTMEILPHINKSITRCRERSTR